MAPLLGTMSRRSCSASPVQYAHRTRNFLRVHCVPTVYSTHQGVTPALRRLRTRRYNVVEAAPPRTPLPDRGKPNPRGLPLPRARALAGEVRWAHEMTTFPAHAATPA